MEARQKEHRAMGGRTGEMQYRRDVLVGQEGCRKGRMQERRDVEQVGCRKDGM